MRRVTLVALLSAQCCFAGLWVTPEYPGAAEDDSVVISFCVFDTTLYPLLTDADSITALRLGPDNNLVDSLDASSAQLQHPRTAWYELHYRAANSWGDVGTYRVFIRAFVGGAWRGAAVVSYEVIDAGVGTSFAQLMSQHAAIQDSVDQALQLLPQPGSGAYACTLFVFDQTAETAIAGAQTTLFNSTETAILANGRTDGSGRLIFALDADGYVGYGRALNYNQNPVPVSITVTSAGSNDTLWLSPFDPGMPSLANLCRVYGYVHDLHGQPIAEVVVKAAIEASSITSNGAVISPFASSTSTDTLGYWFLDLIPSELLKPDTTSYDFSIYYPSGTILRRAVVIPDSGSYWLK